MNLCAYGCGQEGLFQLKNNKWCCSKNCHQCLKEREKVSKANKGKKRLDMTGENNPSKRPEVRQKISDKNKGKNN